MSKIRLKFNIDNDCQNLNGIKSNNRLIFNYNNINIKIIIDNIITVIEENEEFITTLYFDKLNDTIGTYFLKDYNKKIEFDIKTEKIIIKDNFIDINYKLKDIYNNTKVFKLEFEEI